MKRMGFLGLAWGLAFSTGADPALVDFERNWIFPQELGGLKYEVSEKYETADLGYRILYRKGESFEAEVAIYDLGREAIPNGGKGEGIDRVLQSVEDDLQLRLKYRELDALKKLKTRIVSKEKILRFATAKSTYTETAPPNTKKVQAIYVTGIQNQFVRLRFTFDWRKRGSALEMANQMMAQLTKTTTAQPKEEELLMASCSTFLNDPYSYGGLSSAKYLMDKAKEMDNLGVYTHLFVWPMEYWDKPENADLLVAAYFAGMLQVVVPQKRDEGGDFEAFEAMLNTYETLRSKDQVGDIAKIEEWAKHPDRRALYEKLLIVE